MIKKSVGVVELKKKNVKKKVVCIYIIWKRGVHWRIDAYYMQHEIIVTREWLFMFSSL